MGLLSQSAHSLPRETAVEKEGTCPVCGAETPAVQTPYGATRQGACTNAQCTPGDQLDAQTAAAWTPRQS